ncbi:hypothetical protein NA56DRAFT_423022 [Hyaloscypha hepaticicola]|uniref:Uncharacterized protein n=1 Tax=Hyaloscypha hepaticicola TaxID=2082293 RepID=A0A2J6PHF4_9HELO|nr:hypothetical protein NA56DRAFT_423022 [Hyaloscypha hepaticicola]
MANNSTAYILPEWLLPKEPGMTCRPHGTIIGTLAVYNIVSTIVSVAMAGPFFYKQKQQLWNWKRRLLDRFLPCLSCVSSEEEHSYGYISFWSFVMSVLGSVGIALTAPLLAGISISKNHANANRWVLIEQWSTRPRATFVVLINGIMAFAKHHDLLDEGLSTARAQEDGYLETAVTAIFTEVCAGFFGIRFLWEQAQHRSSTLYQSSSPCTTLGTDYGAGGGEPSNCPDMEIGANGLIIVLCFNGVIAFVMLFTLGNYKSSMACVLMSFLTLQGVFMYSWEIWSNFLHHASDDMYCIESSTPLDVIYCLLPVFLGLWRLAWSVGGRRRSSETA